MTATFWFSGGILSTAEYGDDGDEVPLKPKPLEWGIFAEFPFGGVMLKTFRQKHLARSVEQLGSTREMLQR